MKRTIAIAALCAGIMLTTFPSQAKESGNVKINSKNFPDTIVREYVSEKIDKNNDGYLSKKEISAVKTIIINKNDNAFQIPLSHSITANIPNVALIPYKI